MKSIAIIVAFAKNRVIGRDNDLPWRLKRDLRRFKKLTLGHTLVMGRKTYESIGKALPGRQTIVLSRRAGLQYEDAVVADSFDKALELSGDNKVFIAGGAQIYRQFLERANELYLTVIDQDFEGDTLFPELDLSDWDLVNETVYPVSDKRSFGYAFRDYRRRAADLDGAAALG